MPAFATSYSDAPNFAPADKLAGALAAAQSDQTFEVGPEWFALIRQECERENALTWSNHALLWEMLYLFIEGKHLLRRSRTGGWRPVGLPERTDTPVYGYNLAGFYSDSISAKWTQSKPNIRWRALSDKDDIIGATSAADKVWEYLRAQSITESFLQLEAKHAQSGNYARYHYYTNDIKVTGRRERVEQQQLGFGNGVWFCPDCGESGESSDGMNTEAQAFAPALGGEAMQPEAQAMQPEAQAMQPGMAEVPGNGLLGQAMTCPACGSPNAELEQVEPLAVETVTGYEPVEMGDFAIETVSVFELKHDLAFRPHESPYLIRRRRIREAVLQSKFPFLKITAKQSDNAQQQAADNLKYSTYGTANHAGLGLKRGDTEKDKTVDFVQVWLDPSLYERAQLKEGYTTLSGQQIPAGTKLIELFPDGIYSAWVEGVDGCVELRNEHHRDYWVGQVYRPRVGSGLGSGIEDIIEANRQYDLIMSIIYTQLRTAAMPATLFDQRLLPNGVAQYLGSLQNIPVNLTPFDDTKKLSDAVHQLMPQPPTAQHFGFADQLNNYMQLASRVTDFSGALPGVDNNTATGAQIAQSLAQSLFGPQLALKAEVERCSAEILLKLWQRYVPFERYVTLMGKRGKQDGVWLSGASIPTEMRAEIVGESYLPQTALERRQRWQALLLDVGGLLGLKMAQAEMPQLLEQLTDLYDVDLGGEDYTAISSLCCRRVEQMKQALPMLGQWLAGLPPTQMVPDPMTGAPVEAPLDPKVEAGQFLVTILQPPIELEELGHRAAINWCRDWLTCDEGLEAPQELREGVKAMLQAHLQGLMAEQQIAGAVQMAGQPMAQAVAMMPEQSADGKPVEGKPGPDAPPNKQPQAKQMKPGGGQPSPKPQQQGAAA